MKFLPDKDLRPLLVSVLETNIGFEICLFEMLCMFQLEDLRFAVYNQPDTKKLACEGDEYLFDTATEAVDCFLRFRFERSLGYDHEVREEYNLTKLRRVEDLELEEMRKRRALRAQKNDAS